MFSVILRFMVLSTCFVRDMHLVSLWYRLLWCRRSTNARLSPCAIPASVRVWVCDGGETALSNTYRQQLG